MTGEYRLRSGLRIVFGTEGGGFYYRQMTPAGEPFGILVRFKAMGPFLKALKGRIKLEVEGDYKPSPGWNMPELFPAGRKAA